MQILASRSKYSIGRSNKAMLILFVVFIVITMFACLVFVLE